MLTDRTRVIDLDEDWQLGYWSGKLGVKPHLLLKAVSTVGGTVADVKRFLDEESQGLSSE